MCPANHSSPMVAVNHHRQAAHGFRAAERHKFLPPTSRTVDEGEKALLTGSCCWSRRLRSIGRDQLCLQSASPKGRGPPSHNENPPTSGRGGSLTTGCVDIPPQLTNPRYLTFEKDFGGTYLTLPKVSSNGHRNGL